MSATDRRPERGRLPWSWGVAVPGVHDRIQDTDLATQRRVVTRAVTSSASTEELFLWLCQLRRAPYSYDWLDNFGRRSPRVADPELCGLATGQPIMTIFTLTDFVQGESLTLAMNPGWPVRAFGEIELVYRADALGNGRSRLSATMWMPPIGRVLGAQRRYALAWGDLLMMRKQLLVLRKLSESERG